MAAPSPTPLDLVHKAIGAGTYGNIQWKDSAAQLLRDDPSIQSFTPEGIRALLRHFVQHTGARLTQRQETRREYDLDQPYWFRAITPFLNFLGDCSSN